MSHAIMVPVTGQGTVVDQNLSTYLPALMQSKFGCSDVFLYSHGWWTTADAAMVDYSRFSVGFLDQVLLMAQARAGLLPVSLQVGIHWPSVISEDSESIISVLQPLTFYNRAAMADDVGEHGGQSVLRLILENVTKGLNIHILGHSFGCRVVCSTLVELLKQVPKEKLIPHKFNVVLLQAAFDTDALEPANGYGSILDSAKGIPNLRLLVTKSAEDTAVGVQYPRAYKLVHLFGRERTGLGATGPSANTPGVAKALSIQVAPNFPVGSAPDVGESNFVIADLTSLHRDGTVPADSFSGHHSDIYRDEIYRLITLFLG